MAAIGRREFLKYSALCLFAGDAKSAMASGPGMRDTMRYRRLGRTDMRVSEIALGGSPIPADAVFSRAIEKGVNYVDTSSSYMNGNSEKRIGRFMKTFPGRLHVATKFHPGRESTDPAHWRSEIEGSLRRLGVDTLDVLMVHGARDFRLLLREDVLNLFTALKKEGKIRFTGVSCHHNPVEVLRPAIDSGEYDVITVAYNAFSAAEIRADGVHSDYAGRAGITALINRAAAQDVGVVAMKSMAGGNRQDLSRYRTQGISIPQAKLKWVLEQPAVATVISEMLTFRILEENLAVVGQPMRSRENAALQGHVSRWSDTTCRFCGCCSDVCTRRFDIQSILRCRMYCLEYGKTRLARAGYRDLYARSSTGSCGDCRRCDEACPYGVIVSDLVRETNALLAPS